jgi:diaminopimelate epimerase
VELPGGKLKIYWKGPGNSVKMTGPAVHVFDGQLNL